MSLFVLGSTKASPGATTTLLALAAVWPRRVLVAELDPDGGDIAAWFGLAFQPGLVSCAAEGRRLLEPETLLRHTQSLPGFDGVGLLAGPDTAEQARAALEASCSAGLPRCLAGLVARGSVVDVLADCGRLAPESPVVSLIPAARVTLLVARPVLEQVAHLRGRVAALQAVTKLGVLLVGDRPYAPNDVAAAVGAPVVGVMAYDLRGAAAIRGGQRGVQGAARSRLVRSARPFVHTLASAEAAEPLSLTSGIGGRR